ncbi:MAG: hypothetical protein K9J18_05500 [Crocinitomicaceae bacterium]|nr:hypothetical protein [Crocinitomicaceae bacterium]
MSDGVFLEVRATIAAPLDQVWEKWTQAAHVVNWNFAHESWCCPRVNQAILNQFKSYCE